MEIFVPKKIVPVHMFDVYGVILDAEKMGEKAVADFRQVAKDTGIASEVAAKIISDYRALIRNEPWTTSKKVEIIQALQVPLNHAGVKTSYAGCFMEDGIYVIRQALDAGEGVSIFSSGNNDSMRPELPEDIGSRVGNMYDVSKFTFPTTRSKRAKTEPLAFVELVGLEKALGRQVISHTADELPELEAAIESGKFHAENLVFVNRNNSRTVEEVLAAGVGRYVANLKDLDYSHTFISQADKSC